MQHAGAILRDTRRPAGLEKKYANWAEFLKQSVHFGAHIKKFPVIVSVS
jgi:hypothetical protein